MARKNFLCQFEQPPNSSTPLRCPLKTGSFEDGVFRQTFLAGKERNSMKASKFMDAQKAFILKQVSQWIFHRD
tara:strand:- start:22 stop:240 length:219 start_codon:yes stop_codon:yes gene_type:complete